MQKAEMTLHLLLLELAKASKNAELAAGNLQEESAQAKQEYDKHHSHLSSVIIAINDYAVRYSEFCSKTNQ